MIWRVRRYHTTFISIEFDSDFKRVGSFMKICILTGAGVSAASGLETYTGRGGMWNDKDLVRSVATADSLRSQRQQVIEHFNERRRRIRAAMPNLGHFALADLEKNHSVTIITQNIDDLHERAGSTKVLHIHGDIRYKRNERTGAITGWAADLDPDALERPHVCLFGEQTFHFHKALECLSECDLFLQIGTASLVAPADTYIAKFTPS